jgi:hypothetical protein
MKDFIFHRSIKQVASNKCKELKEAQSLLYILSKFGGAEHEIFFNFLQILL